MDDDAPLVTVKLRVPRRRAVHRVRAPRRSTIAEARTDRQTTVDKELALALALPGPMLRGVMAALRGLDAVNLMPAAMIKTDPMYATCSARTSARSASTTRSTTSTSTARSACSPRSARRSKTLCVGRDGKPAVRDVIAGAVDVRRAHQRRLLLRRRDQDRAIGRRESRALHGSPTKQDIAPVVEPDGKRAPRVVRST